MKNYKFWPGILLSVFFLWLALRGVNFEEMIDAIAKVSWWYLIPIGLVTLGTFLVRALRWRYLLSYEKHIKLHSLFSYTIIGFMANNVFPLRIGELARAYIIGKKEGISKVRSLGTIVMERIFDGITLLLFLTLILVYHPGFPDWVKKMGLMLAPVFFLALGGLIVLEWHQDWILKFTHWLTGHISPKLAGRIVEHLQSFIHGLAILRRVDHLLIAFFLSLVLWIVYAGIFHLALQAFHINHLPLYTALFVLTVTAFGVMLPSSPGFIGPFQYFCVKALILMGLEDKSLALSYAFFLHAVQYVLVTLVGLGYLWKENLSLSDLKKAEESEDQII
ncbi:MAG: lysylphosphatidylglycerol synthase transmembrane domain-containing protein [bacterium]|nr:lysylphosphatidylglycerol synthase transmembrane domain-containing protein [bacterium]